MKRISIVVIFVLAALAARLGLAHAMAAEASENCGGALRGVTASFWPAFFVGFTASYILSLVILSLLLLRARESH